MKVFAFTVAVIGFIVSVMACIAMYYAGLNWGGWFCAAGFAASNALYTLPR